MSVELLDATVKAEGIAARVRGSELDLCLVTDADNPEQPSQLIRATMPLNV
ncbi:MAG: hypothetical protein ACRECQ_19810 [Burkholderiaceae bacterium]